MKSTTMISDPNSFIADQRILVHCSAGRGRTGTIIATFLIAEHLLNLSETIFPGLGAGANCKETGFTEKPRQEPDPFYTESVDQLSLPISMRGSKHSWSRISIFAIVRRLREQRWCMVSTDAQYAYCYQFLIQWIKEGETEKLRKLLDRRYGMPCNLNV